MSILEKEAILTEELKKVYLVISSFLVKRNYLLLHCQAAAITLVQHNKARI